MNPALQGYLAAMEESLAAEGTLAEAGRELRAVVGLVEGSNELLLALVDGSVPATARRAVLDHLLEGRVRTEVRSLIHQAVSVEPAGDVVATFHHLASRMEVLAVRGVDPATDSGHDELWADWAPATGCWATPRPSTSR